MYNLSGPLQGPGEGGGETVAGKDVRDPHGGEGQAREGEGVRPADRPDQEARGADPLGVQDHDQGGSLLEMLCVRRRTEAPY